MPLPPGVIAVLEKSGGTENTPLTANPSRLKAKDMHSHPARPLRAQNRQGQRPRSRDSNRKTSVSNRGPAIGTANIRSEKEKSRPSRRRSQDLIAIAENLTKPLPPPPPPRGSKAREQPARVVDKKSELQLEERDILDDFGVTIKLPSRPQARQQSALQPSEETTDILGNLQDHKIIMDIFKLRLIEIKAAKKLARDGFEPVIDHIQKTNNLAHAVDILPSITKSLSSTTPKAKSENGKALLPPPSLASCLDLLSTLRNLLESPYEDYKLVAVLNIEAIISKYGQSMALKGKNSTISGQALSTGIAALSTLIDPLAQNSSQKLKAAAARLVTAIDKL